MLLLIFIMHFGGAAAQEVNSAPQISDIRLLRKLGQYDQALGHLRTLLADNATSEEVRKQAYNELVTIVYLTKGKGDAESAAREALTEFPDLQADPNHHPEGVQLIYESLRKSIFGRLSLSSDPSACDVYLDGKGIGATPLDSIYVPAGEHALRISKFGYEESAGKINVPPGGVTERFVALHAVRNVPTIGIGVEFGPSLEMIAYDEASDQPFAGHWELKEYSAVLRFGGGVLFHLNRHDRLAGQAGVRYGSRGSRARLDDKSSGNDSGEYDIYLNYVSAYVLAKYYVSESPRVYVSAGPEFAYLIGGHVSKTTGTGSTDITDHLERRQIDLVFGAGYEKGFGRHYLVFSAYYTMGLMSLRNTAYWDELDFKPREWRLSAGFILNRKRSSH